MYNRYKRFNIYKVTDRRFDKTLSVTYRLEGRNRGWFRGKTTLGYYNTLAEAEDAIKALAEYPQEDWIDEYDHRGRKIFDY